MVANNILRGMRVFLGITQEQLAERIGWKQEYISLVERGKRRVPKDKAKAMAKALKMLPEDLPVADD